MMKSTMRALALAALGLFALASAGPAGAQEKTDKPAPAPAAKPQDAAKPPEAQRALDDGAIRALAEEVAKLRAELEDLRKSQNSPSPPTPLVEPVDPSQPSANPPAAETAPAAGTDTLVERETVIEREVPVEVERTVYVESPPTVVLERVSYGDVCCDQWIPYHHVHYIGCGHHYYGCSCHPWYWSLGPVFSLSFSFVHGDWDHHGDWDRGRHWDHSRSDWSTFDRGRWGSHDRDGDRWNGRRSDFRGDDHRNFARDGGTSWRRNDNTATTRSSRGDWRSNGSSSARTYTPARPERPQTRSSGSFTRPASPSNFSSRFRSAPTHYNVTPPSRYTPSQSRPGSFGRDRGRTFSSPRSSFSNGSPGFRTQAPSPGRGGGGGRSSQGRGGQRHR